MGRTFDLNMLSFSWLLRQVRFKKMSQTWKKNVFTLKSAWNYVAFSESIKCALGLQKMEN